MMQKVDIKINQAKILSYQITLDDKNPEVYAKIGLYSGEKKISEFSLSNKSYYSGIEFQLPVEMIAPMIEIAKQLEVILVRECNSMLAQIEVKNVG